MQNILKTHYSNNIDYLGIRTIFKELQIIKKGIGFIHIIILSEKPQRKTQLRGCINFNFRN